MKGSEIEADLKRRALEAAPLVLSPDCEGRLEAFDRGGRVILADDAITGALVAAGLIITLPAGVEGFLGASLTTKGLARQSGRSRAARITGIAVSRDELQRIEDGGQGALAVLKAILGRAGLDTLVPNDGEAHGNLLAPTTRKA